MSKKKKVLLHTDFCGASTGFGGYAKELLTYLYKTGKYELYHYACGITWTHPAFQKYPWKCYGALPANQAEINALNQDPNRARLASYGDYNLDNVIKEVKPDVYIGVQDFWGVEYAIGKKWWNKINCAINWTADSLPLLQSALDKAKSIKNHFVWADFATREFHRLGITNVKTLRGTVDTNTFKRLSDSQRRELRQRHGLSEDLFLIGSLSRNQLRKLFPNLIEGFKMFKELNPEVNTKLLFYTHWSEGWDLKKLIEEYKLSPEDVLACYKCRATGDYFVIPFKGQDIDNPKTGHKGSMVTVNLGDHLPTESVNEWYNLLDLFVLPITSGGQERALQEAKLTELITLINPYSCGEDNCVDEAYSLPLEFSEYREIGTQFRKATVYPSSIAKQMTKAYKMGEKKRREWGQKARDWVLKNFSIEVIGKQYEDFIDSLPDHDFDFSTIDYEQKNPSYPMQNIEDLKVWLQDMYKNILKMDVDFEDSGLKYWEDQIKNGASRQSIYDYFVRTAKEENSRNVRVNFEDLLDKDDEGKRVGIIMPESIGDVIMTTSLLKSMKETYPEYNIYFITKKEYFEVLEGNPYIHKVIPYIQQMDSIFFLEGQGGHKGYFEVVYNPYINTQRIITYVHNGKDKLNYDLYYNNKEFDSPSRTEILTKE